MLVWIHGGGFLVGSGSTVGLRGHTLAERGDVVVVTINYRLGALGFGHLGSVLGGELADSTNLGIRDQIAALEWVHDEHRPLRRRPRQRHRVRRSPRAA